jgi:glutamate/tyrosine decarboxylase-like PLP-dependent enzyme
VNLFHGDELVTGTMTSGGTESLLLAVKTYRDYAKKKKPWILIPNIVVPETIHPAVDKAGDYFGVKIKHSKILPNGEVDLVDFKSLIDSQTIALMCSAPQYPHGTIDQVSDISSLAVKKKLPLHVDCCIGFSLPFLEKLSEEIPQFDFRLAGVTSISTDLHKYGFSAKGASVLMWKSMKFMRHQFYVYENWNGGIYASASIPGTKSGGSIAAAWASLNYLGEAGYLEIFKKIQNVRHQFIQKLIETNKIELIGTPKATIICFRMKNISTYAVADELEKHGWHFDRNQKPQSIHLTLSPNHLEILDQFMADLKNAILAVEENPNKEYEGKAAMYGLMSEIPLRGIIKNQVLDAMEKIYGRIPNLDVESTNSNKLIDKLALKFLKLKRKYIPKKL